MNVKKMGYSALLIVVAIASFVTGRLLMRTSAGSAEGARRVLYYIDPMHPAYKSDRSGIAPDCGMKLEPVYADDGIGAADTEKHPVGTVSITPEKQQLIGVETAEADVSEGGRSLRLLGRVAADETRVYRINAAVDGWIQETYPNSTGSIVERDEILASFYTPQFLAAEQGYIYGLAAVDRLKANGSETTDQDKFTEATIQNYVNTLRSLGMSDKQIAALEKQRKLSDHIWITSPAKGVILSRSVSPGQRFDKGAEFYKIVDLGHVWIVADVFENEAQYLKPGMRARVTLREQGKVFTATVSAVPPQFESTTRTLKVRLEADNPGLHLRPDMFVDVDLPVKMAAGLNVPADAVVNSGMRKRVFVDRGKGYFEPREVETGWMQGDRVQITRGLQPGERIVVAGTFLIDSESRMKSAAAGIYSTAIKYPVCGMDVDERKASASGRKVQLGGTTYYFCSEQCKRDFQGSPARYAKPDDEHPHPSPEMHQTHLRGAQKPSSPRVVEARAFSATPDASSETAIDPTCGMTVKTADAAKQGLTSEYRNAMYYFCSSSCKEKFDKDPAKYLTTSHHEGAQ